MYAGRTVLLLKCVMFGQDLTDYKYMTSVRDLVSSVKWPSVASLVLLLSLDGSCIMLTGMSNDLSEYTPGMHLYLSQANRKSYAGL